MNVPVFALAWLAFRNLHELPQQPGQTPGVHAHAFGATLRSRAVWTLAIFLMLYVGYVSASYSLVSVHLLNLRIGLHKSAEESMHLEVNCL